MQVRRDRRPAGRFRSGLAAAVMACALVWVAAWPDTARAAWAPPGVDLSRPRLVMAGDEIDGVRERLTREPYRSVFIRMLARANEARGVPLDDETKEAHRIKSRAAKNLAFSLLVDRTLGEGGEIEPYADASARQAVADRVIAWLTQLYPRSRMAVEPPLGGWDRDISSSEELLQYATAYDALRGAGFDLGASEAIIVARLSDLASELLLNYIEPDTGLEFVGMGAADIHQNNHRAKVGAALMAAGIALADETPPAGSDPKGIREPGAWIDYGIDQMDLVTRWVLTAGDGAYGEGLHYLAFGAQNLHPLMRAWDRLLGGRAYVAQGRSHPSLWRHPLYRRSMRWAFEMTLPDGSLPPFDDAFVARAFPFGSAPRPVDDTLAAAFAWRWANAPEPFQAGGNVDLSADAIVNHVDDLVPAPPAGEPSAVYLEGGVAALRSAWSADAITAIVLGEYDTAAEFGRDRDGVGRAPQSHEHSDAGSFMLHAFGERLLLDPGMVDFAIVNPLGQTRAHSTILVDDEDSALFVAASFGWLQAPEGRPAFGAHGVLHDPIESPMLDAVSVATGFGLPDEPRTQIERRFLFADDRYLVVADATASERANPVFSWLFHGHGGGTSGGEYEPSPVGGRWTRPRARVDVGVAFDAAAPLLSAESAEHEAPGRVRETHTMLRADVSAGPVVHSLELVYPTPTAPTPTAPTPTELAAQEGGDERPAPSLARPSLDGVAALVLSDPFEDRLVAAAHRAPSASPLVLPDEVTGFGEASTDGHLAVFDARADGRLRMAWAEGARRMSFAGAPLFELATPGAVGLRLGDGRADVVVANRDDVVALPPLGFVPVVADGACALRHVGGRSWITLSSERRVTLRAEGVEAEAGGARPAADPGPDRSAAVGEVVVLDAQRSCDADGEAIAAHWELVSAPPGSDWVLQDVDTFTPALLLDRPGPYRLELVVTDVSGRASLPARVLVVAGDACSNGFDDDEDARIDSDDPDCDDVVVGVSPRAAGDRMRIEAGRAFESTLSVLDNDEDDDGDFLSASLVEGPSHGRLLLAADGRFVYEPGVSFEGRDTFTYLARDEHGLESAPTEVTLVGRTRDLLRVAIVSPHGFHFFEGPLAEGGIEIREEAPGASLHVRGSGVIESRDGAAPFELDARRDAAGTVELDFEIEHPALPGGSITGSAIRASLRRSGAHRWRGHALLPGEDELTMIYWVVVDRDRPSGATTGPLPPWP